MPKIYDGSRDKTNFISKKFLEVNSVGTQIMPKGTITVREKGRVDYHVLLVLEGSYLVAFKSENHILSSGSFAIYYPGEPQRYEALENSKSFWLHFSGTSLFEILSSAELVSGVYKARASSSVTKKCYDLLSSFNVAKDGKKATVHLLDLIYKLSELKNEDAQNKIPSPILKSISYIDLNYEKDITVETLAKIAGYSKSRFSHLFSEAMNTTPIKYQNSLRLKNAAEILLSTDVPIGEAALLSGFSDQLYFSRLFRREYGISPTEYREKKFL